jgi:hypothetical protein
MRALCVRKNDNGKQQPKHSRKLTRLLISDGILPVKVRSARLRYTAQTAHKNHEVDMNRRPK